MRRSWYALTALLSFMSARAYAIDGVTLDWSAPETCPSSAAVLTEVERLLGDAAHARENVNAVARISFEDQFSLNLSVNGATGRELHSNDCLELANAAALILAIAIDPSIALAETPARPEQANATNETAAVLATPEPVQASPLVDSDATPIAFGLALGADFAIGLVPPTDVRLYLALRLELSRWSFSLGARLLPSRRVFLDNNAAVGADIGAWAIHANAAYAFIQGPTRLDVVLGVEVGRVTATGFGADLVYTGHAMWLAPELGLRLSRKLLDFLRVRADLGLTVPLRRDDFALRDGRVVDRAEWIGASAGIGVEFIF
ncbi:MAG: hypothetical protein IPK60_10885 [Sandaracinaceae bacterium]|nr:hypothetical protein [Sandaracinaceae bacterium]